MLTRSQVARRLGRSLATVRRLEGIELHPQRDARGVNLFDPDEVDAVASQLAESGSVWRSNPNASRTEYFHGQTRQESQRPSIDESHELLKQVTEAQSKVRYAERELRVYQERVARVFGKLGRDLVEIDPDLGDIVIEAMQRL